MLLAIRTKNPGFPIGSELGCLHQLTGTTQQTALQSALYRTSGNHPVGWLFCLTVLPPLHPEKAPAQGSPLRETLNSMVGCSSWPSTSTALRLGYTYRATTSLVN